jgi:hypothetical protein
MTTRELESTLCELLDLIAGQGRNRAFGDDGATIEVPVALFGIEYAIAFAEAADPPGPDGLIVQMNDGSKFHLPIVPADRAGSDNGRE